MIGALLVVGGSTVFVLLVLMLLLMLFLLSTITAAAAAAAPNTVVHLGALRSLSHEVFLRLSLRLFDCVDRWSVRC